MSKKSDVVELVDKVGYQEFCIQLLMYEYGCSRKKATKAFEHYIMSSEMSSIFNLDEAYMEVK